VAARRDGHGDREIRQRDGRKDEEQTERQRTNSGSKNRYGEPEQRAVANGNTGEREKLRPETKKPRLAFALANFEANGTHYTPLSNQMQITDVVRKFRPRWKVFVVEISARNLRQESRRFTGQTEVCPTVAEARNQAEVEDWAPALIEVRVAREARMEEQEQLRARVARQASMAAPERDAR